MIIIDKPDIRVEQDKSFLCVKVFNLRKLFGKERFFYVVKNCKKILPDKVVDRFTDWAFDLIPMNWSDKKLENELSNKYRAIFGKTINFKNPEGFIEKLQWYKLYYDNPDLGRIVCKYNFKNYIAEKLDSEDYTIPLYGAWKKVKDIDWDLLPNSFV